MERMKTKDLWTTRLALLPLGLLVVGTEVMAQAARTVHDVAEKELNRLFDGNDECCCGKNDGDDCPDDMRVENHDG